MMVNIVACMEVAGEVECNRRGASELLECVCEEWRARDYRFEEYSRQYDTHTHIDASINCLKLFTYFECKETSICEAFVCGVVNMDFFGRVRLAIACAIKVCARRHFMWLCVSMCEW